MTIDTNGLSLLVAEANELSLKPTLNAQETRRNAFLLSGIAAIKAGATLAEVSLNDMNARSGMPKVPRSKIKGKKFEREQRAKDFKNFMETAESNVIYGNTERRTTQGNAGLGTSNGTAEIGSYAGLGFFVPVEFVRGVVKAALKLGDELIREDVSRVIHSTNGRPLVLPTFSDVNDDAVVIGENAQGTVNSVDNPGFLKLGCQSFRQTYVTSMESYQDVEASGNLLNLWQQWTAERTARGLGKYVINGTAAQPGIVALLEDVGVVPVVASGSSANTGGAETGATSIGSADLAALYFGLDKMYRQNACWFMSDLTLLQLAQVVTKSGLPLVFWDSDGIASIFGKPVRVCPTLPTPSASQITVLFGDASYFVINAVNDGIAGVRVLREKYADIGAVGLQTITRFGWGLVYAGYGKAPFTVLQQHS